MTSTRKRTRSRRLRPRPTFEVAFALLLLCWRRRRKRLRVLIDDLKAAEPLTFSFGWRLLASLAALSYFRGGDQEEADILRKVVQCTHTRMRYFCTKKVKAGK